MIDALNSDPTGAANDIKEFWKRMRSMDVELLTKYRKMVDPNTPNITPSQCDYSRWKTEGYIFSGLKHKYTGLAHGIVKVIKPDEFIEEGTYKDGKVYGLVRTVFRDKVQISLFGADYRLATFGFDRKFNEVERVDPDGYLN